MHQPQLGLEPQFMLSQQLTTLRQQLDQQFEQQLEQLGQRWPQPQLMPILKPFLLVLIELQHHHLFSEVLLNPIPMHSIMLVKYSY